MKPVFYRIEDARVSVTVDADRELYESRIQLYLRKYKVLKTTRCGVWLDLGFGGKRFVLTNARKKFACATLEEAKESFRARKERQIGILQTRINQIKEGLRQCQYLKDY